MKTTLRGNLTNSLPKRPSYQQALDFRKREYATELAREIRRKVEARADRFQAGDQGPEDVDQRPGQVQVGGPNAPARKRTRASAKQTLAKIGIGASIVAVPFAAAAALAAPPLLAAPVVLAMISARGLARDSTAADVGHLRLDDQSRILSFEGENGDSSASVTRNSEGVTYRLKLDKKVDNLAIFRGDEVEVTTTRRLRDASTLQLPSKREFQKQKSFEVDPRGNLPNPGTLPTEDARHLLAVEQVMEVVKKSVETLKAHDQTADDLDIEENRVVIAPGFDPFSAKHYGGILESDPNSGAVTAASGFEKARSGFTKVGGRTSVHIGPRQVGEIRRHEFSYRDEGAEETFLLNDHAVVKNRATGTVTLYATHNSDA
jgi:hypothetical protein